MHSAVRAPSYEAPGALVAEREASGVTAGAIRPPTTDDRRPTERDRRSVV
jgi:hypothetical protein